MPLILKRTSEFSYFSPETWLLVIFINFLLGDFQHIWIIFNQESCYVNFRLLPMNTLFFSLGTKTLVQGDPTETAQTAGLSGGPSIPGHQRAAWVDLTALPFCFLLRWTWHWTFPFHRGMFWGSQSFAGVLVKTYYSLLLSILHEAWGRILPLGRADYLWLLSRWNGAGAPEEIEPIEFIINLDLKTNTQPFRSF